MTADPTSCFSPTHAAARAAFLAACGAAGAEVVSHRHPLPGPEGEPLFLDEGRVGAPDARRVLFVASGTHGIESFCGSGIQTFLLRGGLAHVLPPDVAVVLVHAVNPWGFAWQRRVNEDNVDVNRNFLDHGAPHPANPDYDRLYDALNPATLDDATLAAGFATLRAFEEEHGPAASYRALSGGQYAHPRGVQYGGRVPVWSNRVLRDLWARHGAGAELVAYVDLHSGLGPCGTGLLLQTAPEQTVAAELARAWWSDVIRTAPGEGGDAALASGLIGPAFVAAHPHAAAVGVVLELGTLDMVTVMRAVQADNWLHHHGARDSEAGRDVARRMREAFFLEDAAWQVAVCERARTVVQQALHGMAAFRPAPPSAVRVRPARTDDRDVLVAFAQAMAEETEGRRLDPDTLGAGVDALLADPERGRTFVVESESRVVASLMLTLEWSEWRNGFFWWIQSVYVVPGARRRGHYRRLHEHVCALAATLPDVFGIRLYVEEENHAAQATYRALGMEETPYRIFEQPTRRR